MTFKCVSVPDVRGREFQKVGVAMANARSPKVRYLVSVMGGEKASICRAGAASEGMPMEEISQV